jgi:hypothetical protein
MKKFHTRLFARDDELPPEWKAFGLGWTVTQRHFEMRVPLDFNDGPILEPEAVHHIRAIVGSSFTRDGYYCSRLAPELIIEAEDFEHAQRVLRLISAGYAATDMMLVDEDSIAVPDDPSDYPEGRSWEMEYALKRGSATDGHFRAARIAAAASKKLVYQHALAKFLHGFRLAGIHWMDTHPTQAKVISTTSDPIIYINYALAIIAYYSVLEELCAHVIASKENPSKLPDGSWNPTVLNDLKERLVSLGINPDSTVVWLLRGSPSLIEITHKPPEGAPTSWAGNMIRDREISICDAISYASVLRSRVSAHRTSKRTQSLTAAHVCNVQMLAREVLLLVMGDDYTTPATIKPKRYAASGNGVDAVL